jgi:4-amino-4-deoxy-L-arabinose transferase-like glycosyltransferase
VSSRAFHWLLFGLILAFRLCHSGIVWVEEGYPLAAAAEMLRGQFLYKDIWFDKPPLFPAVYLLWGAKHGWLLRVAGAAYVFLCAWAAGRMALRLWGEREQRFAAALMAFFLTFWIPSAVMVLGPDLLLIPLQIAAVLAAWRGQAFAAGLLAGFGLLLNAKMAILLPAVFVPRGGFVLGLLLPQAMLIPVAEEYWRQVWAWGAGYSADTFVADAWREGTRRTWNWMGFHCALIAGACCAFAGLEKRWRWALWLACSFAAVIAGFRFFPRYYFLLLAPLAVLAARGVARQRWMLLLLLIPLIRFGPKYPELARDLMNNYPHEWADLAMERDSRAVAELSVKGTMLVWGYRPELYALTGNAAGTRFLDSQPLTGVLADRHLISTRATFADLAAENRRELVRTRPEWILDGLGPYNPGLAITKFEDLREWLADYEVVGRTKGTILYRRR